MRYDGVHMETASSVFDFLRSLPTDWIVIAGTLLLLGFDALRSGDGRATALALSFPLAAYLFSLLPSAPLFSSLPAEGTASAGVFIALSIGVFFLIRRMFFFSDGGGGRPIQEILSVVAATAIVVSVWSTTPALSALWAPGSLLQAVFNETYALWILAVSFAALAFARS